MKKIFYSDMRELKEFARDGYQYAKIKETDKYMIWEIRKDGILRGYELWKPRMKKNPDGNVVWVRPSDEEFGVYGWYSQNLDVLKRRI